MNVRPTSTNDESLQENSLEELFPKLYRYCLFLTKDKWDGEDIAQEAILKSLRNYNINEVSSALLKKIAYHVWVDRTRKYENESIIDASEYEFEKQSNNEIDTDLIEKLLKHLTPKQLLSFVLKEAFQYKISEIAEVLDMTETGVKALLNRARTKVKGLSNSPVLESIWTEHYHEVLYPILIQAIATQDPSVLIQLIPSILPTSRMISTSPSNILSMAA